MKLGIRSLRPDFIALGSVRLENYLLRSRIYVDARSSFEFRLEPQLRRYSFNVARWLHYPQVFTCLSLLNLVLSKRIRSLIGESVFSAFLGNIKSAFQKNPDLKNLLLDPFFKEAITKAQASWRCVVSTAALAGVPTPAFSTALAFYDGYRSARLPANLLQVSDTSSHKVNAQMSAKCNMYIRFSRLNEISSEPILTNSWTSRANLCTLIGPDMEVTYLQVRTRFKVRCSGWRPYQHRFRFFSILK